MQPLSDASTPAVAHSACGALVSLKVTSYLGCHDEAGGSGVDGDVTGHQPHVLELFVHFSVLLVGESFDGAGEDHPLFLSEGQCNGVSASAGHKRLIDTTVVDCLQLKVS